jgi:hypothetical protein
MTPQEQSEKLQKLQKLTLKWTNDLDRRLKLTRRERTLMEFSFTTGYLVCNGIDAAPNAAAAERVTATTWSAMVSQLCDIINADDN